MLSQTLPTIIPRAYVVTALTKLRQEWELAAEGNSLISIDASVGLILADVAMTIGLTSIEQLQVFGAELADELKFVLVSAPGNNGNH